MAITNIEELIEDAVDTLEKLKRRELEVEEVGVIGKVYETIISAVKVQLYYGELTGGELLIPFMGDMNKGRVINMSSSIKALADQSKKKKPKKLK